jgi:single-strand DNA-binding protein
MSTPVTLRGRLTRDPEMRFSASGKPVTTFAVVTSRRWKNEASGEWEDKDTTFWDCVAFSSLAENIAESLTKGTAVVVTGSAYQEEWEDKSGQKRRSLKVTADDVAPSLRFASAKISRAERQAAATAAKSGTSDPWAGDEPPF